MKPIILLAYKVHFVFIHFHTFFYWSITWIWKHSQLCQNTECYDPEPPNPIHYALKPLTPIPGMTMFLPQTIDRQCLSLICVTGILEHALCPWFLSLRCRFLSFFASLCEYCASFIFIAVEYKYTIIHVFLAYAFLER